MRVFKEGDMVRLLEDINDECKIGDIFILRYHPICKALYLPRKSDPENGWLVCYSKVELIRRQPPKTETEFLDCFQLNFKEG